MFVGVDGCKKGWVKVGLTAGDEWEVKIFPDINSLWNDSKHFSSIPKRRRIDIALKIVYKKLLDAVSSNPSAPSPATGQ